jgi:hypothetical protein
MTFGSNVIGTRDNLCLVNKLKTKEIDQKETTNTFNLKINKQKTKQKAEKNLSSFL